jgi:oxalate decarboxylase/phosphoglucose isomerase-like protein (cupin superfamily)
VVEPGETLYLPAGWAHATVNLGQSVFVSSFLL